MSSFDQRNMAPITSRTSAYDVGYGRPPAHSRFKPGHSGNPSGRVKGSKNLKTLFHQILNEQVPLQDGSKSKVTKAEALMRRLVIGALKGESRSLMTLMRIAEQTGEFADGESSRELIIHWSTIYEAPPQIADADPSLPANRRGQQGIAMLTQGT
jgi:Family of unknown function (DUF5681)